MKKFLFSMLAVVMICTMANAETVIATSPSPTNAPSVSEAGATFFKAAVEAGRTNLTFVPYVIFTPGLQKKEGFGLGVFYGVSEHVVTGLRFEYLNESVWMPNGTCTFKQDFHIPVFTNVVFSPFVYAGIGYPLSGLRIAGIKIPGKDNQADDLVGISGIGATILFFDSERTGWQIGAVGDIEKWSSVPDQEYRVGLRLRKRF